MLKVTVGQVKLLKAEEEKASGWIKAILLMDDDNCLRAVLLDGTPIEEETIWDYEETECEGCFHILQPAVGPADREAV